jgi:hypothetical protein
MEKEGNNPWYLHLINKVLILLHLKEKPQAQKKQESTLQSNREPNDVFKPPISIFDLHTKHGVPLEKYIITNPLVVD